jgi:hypothetical protein
MFIEELVNSGRSLHAGRQASILTNPPTGGGIRDECAELTFGTIKFRVIRILKLR